MLPLCLTVLFFTVSHRGSISPFGRSPFLCFQASNCTRGSWARWPLARTGLTDNLTFAAAVQMLAQLAAQGFLSAEEQARTRQELERKLRPTLILP